MNADHIAMLLEEHARVEDGRLANIPYLAVKLAELADAAEPFFAIAKAVTDTADPGYREWFDEAGDHCVALGFAGVSITLGDLRRAAKAIAPTPVHADDCQSHIVDVRGRPDECTCGASFTTKADFSQETGR